jgi:3-hydroxymyristoyl/3-hydroxydecanoyl-(acyl carrier protein) dehydratase
MCIRDSLVISPLTEIGGQIGWLATGMEIKFKKPVYCGDTIECVFTITEIDERNNAKAEMVFTNQAGLVVAEAILTGKVPGVREKQIMHSILSEGDPTNGLSRQIHIKKNR